MSATKAPFGFFLDGGYDSDIVEACTYHPWHSWTTLRLGAIIAHPYNPDETVTFCRACYVIRCGQAQDSPNRCKRPRHHQEWHVFPDGTSYPVGGNP